MIAGSGEPAGAIAGHIGGRDVTKPAAYAAAAHSGAMGKGAAGRRDREGNRSRRAGKETGEIKRCHG